MLQPAGNPGASDPCTHAVAANGLQFSLTLI
jgi:hypothetical protein